MQLIFVLATNQGGEKHEQRKQSKRGLLIGVSKEGLSPLLISSVRIMQMLGLFSVKQLASSPGGNPETKIRDTCVSLREQGM